MLREVEETLLTLSSMEETLVLTSSLQRDLRSARLLAALGDFQSCDESLIRAEARAIRFDVSDLDDIIVRLERHRIGLTYKQPSYTAG